MIKLVNYLIVKIYINCYVFINNSAILYTHLFIKNMSFYNLYKV